jgi:hypothetical protein
VTSNPAGMRIAGCHFHNLVTDQALRVVGEMALPDGFVLNRQILAQERQRRRMMAEIYPEFVKCDINFWLRPILATAIAVAILAGIGKVGFISVVVFLPVNWVGEHRRLQRLLNLRKDDTLPAG